MLGNRAVVVGAGVGGLTAAAALSRHFESVTVLDRDALPDAPCARPGAPQGRQLHALLGGGFQALSEFFPDFEQRLDAAGAVRIRTGLELRAERLGFDPLPQRDLGWDTFCLTRPLLEHLIRTGVAGLRNVAVRSRARAMELVPSADRQAVQAVRYEDVEGQCHLVTADLVVDASSRGALTGSFLATHGFARPEETEIGVDLGYATATYAIPDDAPSDWKAVMHTPSAPESGRGGFIFPIERDRWHVALNGNHGDAPPADRDGFLAFAKSLRTPTIYEAVKNSRPIEPIHRFGLPCSVRRHFERLDSFPDGLVVLGDAVCRFNPVFGQGMSVAAQQASILAKLLSSRAGQSNPVAALALPFFKAIQGVLASPWSTAETDLVYPKTRGRRPDDFKQRLQYYGALLRISCEDVEVQRTMNLVGQLMAPATLLREPALAERVNAALAAAPSEAVN